MTDIERVPVAQATVSLSFDVAGSGDPKPVIGIDVTVDDDSPLAASSSLRALAMAMRKAADDVEHAASQPQTWEDGDGS